MDIECEGEFGEDPQRRRARELAHLIAGDVPLELAADQRGDLLERDVAVREKQCDQRRGPESVVAGGVVV
jgi:hypothetical protein